MSDLSILYLFLSSCQIHHNLFHYIYIYIYIYLYIYIYIYICKINTFQKLITFFKVNSSKTMKEGTTYKSIIVLDFRLSPRKIVFLSHIEIGLSTRTFCNTGRNFAKHRIFVLHLIFL